MNPALAPSNINDLVDAVRSTEHLLAVGARTKPRLSAVEDRFTRLSTLQLRGIVEYEPDEYTITALAGTPLTEITAALNARGQYLPFDPLYVGAGSSLGGAVAAGMNGPGRFRFGGCRDFILAVQFVDGSGQLLRMGAKVVKNAAGFDLPKFLVGSLGRFGVLAEITFKVFPRPASSLTLHFRTKSIAASLELLGTIGCGRWEAEALDILPGNDGVCVRLSGPPEALPQLAKELLGRWPGEQLSPAPAESLWTSLRESTWAHAHGCLVKVPCSPATVPEVWACAQSLEDGRVHVSSGGNVAFVSVPSRMQIAELDKVLARSGLTGLTLRGEAPLWVGAIDKAELSAAIKDALDPLHRFPLLQE